MRQLNNTVTNVHSKLQKLIGVYAIQHLVNLRSNSNLTVEIKGRHRDTDTMFFTPVLKEKVNLWILQQLGYIH